MDRVLVVYSKENANAVGAFLELEPFLNSEGVIVEAAQPNELPDCKLHCDRAFEKCDLIVVLGGDGTILRSSRLAEMLNAPILGINFGHLGFLANPCEASVCDMVAAALDGAAGVEERANMKVKVQDAGGTHECFALNEVAARSVAGHIIDLSLSITEETVAHMRADGAIVATATGSTAYALSAGGPLVSPRFDGLVVVPIAPHTLTSRAICTESGDDVSVVLDGYYDSRDVAVFLDGDALETTGRISRITATVGSVATKLLRLDEENFYRRVSNVFFQ